MELKSKAQGAALALTMAFASVSAGVDAAAAAPKGPPPAAFPNTKDGKPIMQIGVGGLAYYSLEDPFLNLFHNMSFDDWVARGPNRKDVDFAAMRDRGLVDEKTMLPRAVPAGYSVVTSGLFRFGARYYPDYYAGTYVVEWDGSAKAQCGFGHATVRVNANRIECTYTRGDKAWGRVDFTRIGAGFSNPRLYRKENAARVKAGEIFEPRFLEHLHRYKVIRTLDLQAANISWIRSVNQLANTKHTTWGQSPAYMAANRIPRGVPVETLFDMAVASDTALWMHVAGLVGAPAAFEDPQLADGRRDIRALARTHAKRIIASPEWRAYANEIVRSMKASGYPRNRMLYIEQSNEVWNFAHPFWRTTNYFWGLGEGIGGKSKGYSWALGYVTAHFAVTFDKALREKGRGDQPWVAVLAGQMANTQTTKQALAGFQYYFSERRLNAKPYLAHLGVATASYYQGVFDIDGVLTATTASLLEQQWLSAILANPAALARRATDLIVKGPETKVGTLPNLIKRRQEHQKLAESAGAFFLGDYEGESHELGGGPLRSNPRFVNWAEDWMAGPEGERMTRAWVEALRKQNPNAVIANYATIGARDPEGDSASDTSLVWPWIDNFWTEETGRTRALQPYLRQ